MTERSKEETQPSIEEILASIRGIISEDINKKQKSEPAPHYGDVDDNSDSKIVSQAASVFSDSEVTNELKSPKNLEKEVMERIIVNDLAKELMRPIIKEWLDQNLLKIVERAVEREVERLARLSEKKE